MVWETNFLYSVVRVLIRAHALVRMHASRTDLRSDFDVLARITRVLTFDCVTSTECRARRVRYRDDGRITRGVGLFEAGWWYADRHIVRHIVWPTARFAARRGTDLFPIVVSALLVAPGFGFDV